MWGDQTKERKEMGEPKEEEGNQTRERKKGKKWRTKEAKERVRKIVQICKDILSQPRKK